MKITRQSDGNEIIFPRGSDIGLACDLTVIGEAVNLRRTVSGALRNLADPAFRKYALTITSSGLKLPALEGLWEGDHVVVEAPMMLRELGDTPSRPFVPGSERIDGGYVEYRPIFDALVVAKQSGEQLTRAVADWSITVEEI